MNDTPRTDAECARQNNEGWSLPDTRKLGRQLERELAEAREQRDRLEEALRELWNRHTLHGAAYELIEQTLAAVKGGSDE